MKILHVHSLHLHPPWLESVSRLSREFAAVTVAGDGLPISSFRTREQDTESLRNWIAGLDCTCYYSRGQHDPDMTRWDVENLRLSGTHEHPGSGWSIHVIDTYSTELRMPHATTLPEIVVSHFAPAGSHCGIDEPSGQNFGRGDVRAILQSLGDIRLVLSGRVWQPREKFDWAEGAMCACPGMTRAPGNSIFPATCAVDCETRSLKFWDGIRHAECSFTR